MTRAVITCRCRSEEHTSELQSQSNLVCRLLLEKKNHTLRFPAGFHYALGEPALFHLLHPLGSVALAHVDCFGRTALRCPACRRCRRSSSRLQVSSVLRHHKWRASPFSAPSSARFFCNDTPPTDIHTLSLTRRSSDLVSRQGVTVNDTRRHYVPL